MNYPTTREEAKRTGAKYYFTNKPCTRGHVAPRKTKGCCVECMKEDWVTDNERRKTLPKSEASKAAGRRYYERNKDAVIARAAARPIEEKRRHKDNYKKENPEVINTSWIKSKNENIAISASMTSNTLAVTSFSRYRLRIGIFG